MGDNLFGSFEESGTIAEAFDVKDDDASFRVVLEKGDIVRTGENGFVARADGGADTETPTIEGEKILNLSLGFFLA